MEKQLSGGITYCFTELSNHPNMLNIQSIVGRLQTITVQKHQIRPFPNINDASVIQPISMCHDPRSTVHHLCRRYSSLNEQAQSLMHRLPKRYGEVQPKWVSCPPRPVPARAGMTPPHVWQQH